VFTSVRDGDPEIYTLNADRTGVRRLTHEPGYDGGPFFSPDGRIVYRRDAVAATRPSPVASGGRGLYAPAPSIWVMDRDGPQAPGHAPGAASFAPYFRRRRRIVFASNHPDARSRNFDLYLVNDDGTGLERVTTDPTFDSFPMFSPDGKQIVFASNRGGKAAGETNLFLADWVEKP
jgi:Tol biopolymer transport system component